MKELKQKQSKSLRRAHKVRTTIRSNTDRPRLSINVSNMHISTQVIDDSTSTTLASATTVGQKSTGTMTEKASWVGSEIAKAAKKAKVSKVAFDRGDRKYHGRVKALADAARAAGLEF
jgi:large subunit ribosomal protein L18